MATNRPLRSAYCTPFLLLFLLAPAWLLAAPVIQNGDQPLKGHRVAKLQELWRVGGIDDEENLFGLVRRAVADDEDNVYLLDTQLIEVLVYDADGQYVHSLGREGEGPGEFKRPGDVVLLPDGTVGLMQVFPGQIVRLHGDGTPAGRWHPGGDPTDGGTFSLRKVVAAGDRFATAGSYLTRDDGTRTSRTCITSYNAAGETLNHFYEFSYTRELMSNRRDETSRYFPSAWTLSADGRVWVPPHRDEYLINVYFPDGSLQRTITRKFEHYFRDADEIELVRKFMTPWGGRNNRQWDVVVEPTTRDIMHMHVDDRGKLWVMSSQGAHPQEPGIHSVWDVFDTDGQFEEVVALECEGNAIDDAILFPGNDLVLVIMESTDAVMASRSLTQAQETDDEEEALPIEVICYRLDR